MGTGETREVTSEPDGSYSFVELPAGEYELRWSVAGERHVVHSVTIPLHIGGTSEDE